MELPVEVGVDVMEAGVVVNGVESVIPTQYAYVGHRPLQSVCAAGFHPKKLIRCDRVFSGNVHTGVIILCNIPLITV